MTAANNPLSDETDQETTLTTVLGEIIEEGNIIKTKPLKEGQTGMFHIGIRSETLVISAGALMAGQGAFNTIFFDTFSIVLPKSKKWSQFIAFIAQNAKDGGLEENNAGMAADIIFETLCKDFDITDDKEQLIEREECQNMVRHSPHGKEYYAVPSKAMSDLFLENKISSTLADVSQAMAIKGMKTKKTHDVKVNGKVVKCWYFVTDEVNRMKGEK